LESLSGYGLGTLQLKVPDLTISVSVSATLLILGSEGWVVKFRGMGDHVDHGTTLKRKITFFAVEFVS
jgi:hypothetical protein